MELLKSCSDKIDMVEKKMLEITEDGEALKDQAVTVPQRIADCISLEPQEAMELYRILYKILGKEI